MTAPKYAACDNSSKFTWSKVYSYNQYNRTHFPQKQEVSKYLFFVARGNIFTLRRPILKYSRSLYEDGLLNIKVLRYDPVLLYYWDTEQHHGTQDVYKEYLVLVWSIQTM
jgi:hypothetical protein